MELVVPRLNCGGCVRGVTRAVHRVDPDAEVVCDLQTQQVSITTRADPARILAELAEVGYPGLPAEAPSSATTGLGSAPAPHP